MISLYCIPKEWHMLTLITPCNNGVSLSTFVSFLNHTVLQTGLQIFGIFIQMNSSSLIGSVILPCTECRFNIQESF